MKAFPGTILLALGACSDGLDRGSDLKPTQNIAQDIQTTVQTGVLATGLHGPVLVTDEEINTAKAKAKGGFWEAVGMPIKAEDPVRLELRDLLKREIAKSAAAGIPEPLMQWRVALEGTTEAFPTDGYMHQFRLRRIILLEPCPKQPVSSKGCLDYP